MPVKKMWSALVNINEWSLWQIDISYASLQGSLAAGSLFTLKIGGAKIIPTLHTVEPHSLFGWAGRTDECSR